MLRILQTFETCFNRWQIRNKRHWVTTTCATGRTLALLLVSGVISIGSSGCNEESDSSQTTSTSEPEIATSTADDEKTDELVDAGTDDDAPVIDVPVIDKDGWPLGKPEDYGLDTVVLEEAAEKIQSAGHNRYGMVVIRKGVLIFEKYWDGGPDDKHIIYSCTKSWGSTLIGIAVTQGLLSVKDEVRKWVPDPVDGIAEGATVENLLTQSAHSNPPGTAFKYDMGTLINTLPEILEAASGKKNHDFYETYLAQPLDISMIWPQCPAGGCPGTRYNEGFIQFGNNPASGAPLDESPQSSVRDQAKLGWLWANNGVWNDEVIIDPAFIAAGSTGQDFNEKYGYLWWIDNEEQYSAKGGMGNCFVNIMPSRQLVIAVMGDDIISLSDAGSWGAFQSVVDAIKD